MSTALQIGDTIPEFTLKNQHDKDLSLGPDYGKPLVIYFYPKDDTPGCTKEACYFRDQYDVFADYNATIIGISGDRPKSHLNFAEKYNLNFDLLSDRDKEVEKLFGVKRNFLGLLPGRVTFIFDKQGILVHVFSSQFNATQHVDEAIKILEGLN